MCLQHPRLPVELQHEIALMLKDEPDVHSCYALVSKNFYRSLRPYLYPRVRLTDTDMAADFVDFMLARGTPRNVRELYIGQLVNAVQAADAISECCNITTLTIRFPFGINDDTEDNLLLQPLANLQSLKSLSIALVTLTNMPVARGEVDLSEFQIFHRLTHLHLIGSVDTYETTPLGLSKLPNLTHLSLHWFQSRHSTTCLRQFLARGQPSCRILVLWVPGSALPERLERRLVDHNLVDRRVVLFEQERYNQYMRNGGFWKFAERLVAWKIENKSSPFAANKWLELPVWYNLLNGGKSSPRAR